MDDLLAAHWPDDCIWMVNGPAGRRPVNAGSEEEAIDYYVNNFKSLY